MAPFSFLFFIFISSVLVYLLKGREYLGGIHSSCVYLHVHSKSIIFLLKKHRKRHSLSVCPLSYFLLNKSFNTKKISKNEFCYILLQDPPINSPNTK